MESINAIGTFTLGSADPTVFAFTRTGSATAWSRQPPACGPDNVRVPSGGIFLCERKHNRTVVNTCLGFKTYLLKKKKQPSSVEPEGSQWRGEHVEVKVPAVLGGTNGSEVTRALCLEALDSLSLSLSRITSHFNCTFCREFYPLEMLTVTEHGKPAAN